MVSLIILALYFWAYFADVRSIASALLISDTAAAMAGVALGLSVVSYFWAPKNYVAIGTGVAYGVLCLTTAFLIVDTGGSSSPFLALWMLVAVFAGVFGWYGLLPLFVATLGYMGWLSIADALTRETIVTIVLAGELPLAASYLIWHTKSSSDSETTDKAYKELAAEYSQVSGQADTVINAIADGVIALNGKGAIQLINPAAEQLIGWGRTDALSLDYKSVLSLAGPNDAELTPGTDPISRALATNTQVSTDSLSLTTKSGKKLLVAMTVSPSGQPGKGVIIVFRDITNEKAEEREQAEFVSTASHEMRTPVASIEGYLGLALNPETAQIDDKARDYITKAHESAQHLGRLFQDLLDVTKADDGRLANNPKVTDVVAFTHDVVEALRPKAEEKGLRMLYKPIPEDQPDNESGEKRLNPVYYANVDNDHLREIISNLIDNAIKYTPKGEIVIDVGGDNEHVVVSVVDSGIGIPKEDIPHLFQKFYRVDSSDTREIGGTGLGLYLSRRLAESMNGRMWVESEFQRGSSFYLEVPRIGHEEAMRLIDAAALAKEEEPPQIIPERKFASPNSHPAPPVIPPAPAEPQPKKEIDTDTTYTNAPATAIAAELQASRPAPPPPAPPSAQPQVAPLAQVPYTVPRVNTPIASIEQDPSRYLRPQQGGLSVPPRNQN